MDNKVIYELASDNANMSDLDRLVNLYWALSATIFCEVDGDVVEVGCNAGKTAVFFRMVLDHYKSEKEIHVYDSFEGLPRPGPQDAYLKEGDCSATVEDLLATFAKWGVKAPRIHKGWFDETLRKSLPEKISFAYLDGDFFDSIKVSLEEVGPRMAPGGILIVDDYCDKLRAPRSWDGLPGVKAACDVYEKHVGKQFSALCGVGDLSFAMMRF
jgi:O-methyltransferase